jgi:MFS transporter, YNFM family, putative membrane transport protein
MTTPLDSQPITSEGHHAEDLGFRRAALAMFAAGLATFALLYLPQPLLPTLSRSFRVSPAASTLSLSISSAALALSFLPAGLLADCIGRTRVMAASVLTASALGVACAAAPSFVVLLVMRGLTGVALAGLPAVAMAYLTEEIHAGSLGRSMGLYIAGNAFGGMLGRLLAGGLAQIGGWRLAMAAVGMLSVGCAAAFARLIPPSVNFVARPPAISALARRLRENLADPGLLRLYCEGGLLMGAFVVVYNALSFRLEAAPYHLSQLAVAAVFLVYPVGSLSSGWAGRFADQIGRRAVLPVAIAVAGCGLALMGARSLPFVIGGVAALTAGFFASHSVASSWIGRRARGSPAQASALYLMAYHLGSAIAGPAGGAAWSNGGWSTVMIVAGSLLTTALLISFRLRHTPPLVPAAPSVAVQPRTGLGGRLGHPAAFPVSAERRTVKSGPGRT